MGPASFVFCKQSLHIHILYSFIVDTQDITFYSRFGLEVASDSFSGRFYRIKKE
jgi:hypothetical protein